MTALRWPKWVWFMIGGLYAADCIGMWLLNVSLDRPSWIKLGFVVLFSLALLIMTSRKSLQPTIRTFGSGLAVIMLAWPALRIANHLSMRNSLQMVDELLASWDRSIAFDWLSYTLWVDRRPLMFDVMNIIYSNLTLYSAVSFVLFLLVYGAERAREFILLFFPMALFSIAAGAFFPAFAPMAHYAPDLSLFEQVNASTGTAHVSYLLALREAPAIILNLDHLPGLVTFPSFHTAMGVLCIYGSRGRWVIAAPVFAVNSVMIASTPVLGSHYLVDVFAGLGYSIAIIAVYARSTRRVLKAPMPGVSDHTLSPIAPRS